MPAPPAVLGWATGNLPEPRNNPQVGMANMRTIMPALQKAKLTSLVNNGPQIWFQQASPSQQRQTRVVKVYGADAIAQELVEWMEPK